MDIHIPEGHMVRAGDSASPMRIPADAQGPRERDVMKAFQVAMDALEIFMDFHGHSDFSTVIPKVMRCEDCGSYDVRPE